MKMAMSHLKSRFRAVHAMPETIKYHHKFIGSQLRELIIVFYVNYLIELYYEFIFLLVFISIYLEQIVRVFSLSILVYK